MEKQEFIKDFGELCKKYKINNIVKMEYIDDCIEETVIVTYDNGYKKRICVTMDSLSAMICDIKGQGGF